MPDYAYKTSPEAPASPDPTAPLRDWLSTISRREARGEVRSGEPRRAEAEEGRVVELPRPRPVAREPEPEATDVEALIAENMMLRAKLRSEDARYASLQDALADELRSLRALVEDEAERADALREERDLWMARAEALAQPLFQRR